MYEHIIHSWVGYELVKVLLKYGLSPNVRSDLKDWSEDLYELFAYFDEKQPGSTERPNTQLTILFDKTDHCSYFEKLGFGKKMRFEKMPNTIIPLVILTWLRQLQEHVFKISDHSSQTDWSDMGRYFTQPPNKAVSKGVNHVHMSKAKNQVVQRMKSFHDVIPKTTGRGTEKVIRSLLEWADMILFREHEYVEDMVTYSFKEGETSIRNKYAMKKKENFKQGVQEETIQEDEIEEITPATHTRKTQYQLMTVVSDFMTDEIKKLTKAKKRNIASINSANRAVECLVQYVNTVEQKTFTSIMEMTEYMADKDKSNKKTNEDKTSSDEYSDTDTSDEE